MTQLDLEKSIASRTGDSLRTIRRLGFKISELDDPNPDAETLDLYVDCPFCGHTALQSTTGIDGLPPSAECPRCDVYFDYQFDELYSATDRSETSGTLQAA